MSLIFSLSFFKAMLLDCGISWISSLIFWNCNSPRPVSSGVNISQQPVIRFAGVSCHVYGFGERNGPTLF